MKSIVAALAVLSFGAAPAVAQGQAAPESAVPEVPAAGVAQDDLPTLPGSQIPAGAVIVGGLVILGGVVIAIAAGDDGTTSTTSTAPPS